jgi:hypothetical protein
MERALLVSRGRRRKALVALVATVGAIAVVAPNLSGGAGAAAPPPAPSNDIHSYALFAKDSLRLKGGGASDRSIVHGNIGVGTEDRWDWFHAFAGRKDAPSNNGVDRLTLCSGSGSNGHLDLVDPGSYVMSPSMSLGESCNIGLAYTMAGDAKDAQTNFVYLTYSSPRPDVRFPTIDPANANAFPVGKAGLVPGKEGTIMEPVSNACSKPDVKLTGQVKGSLDADTVYGDIKISGKTTLGPGVYTFCSLKTSKGELKTDPNTVINVVGKLTLGGSGFGSSPKTLVNVGGTTITFGRQGEVTATINAPNADVGLGRTTEITGEVWARTIHSDWAVNVTGTPPVTTPPTTEATTTPTTASSDTTFNF